MGGQGDSRILMGEVEADVEERVGQAVWARETSSKGQGTCPTWLAGGSQ